MAVKNIILWVIVGSLCFPAHARVLQYFPRDENIEGISISKTIILRETNCPALSDLYQRWHNCQKCMVLKQNCPNCCLVYNCCSSGDHYEAIRCVAGEDPAYCGGCNTDQLFSANSCPVVTLSNSEYKLWNDCSTLDIPYAQKRGCNQSVSLNPIGEQKCIGSYCNTNNVQPRVTGCSSAFRRFTGRYYNIKEISGDGCPAGLFESDEEESDAEESDTGDSGTDEERKCYKYTLTDEYRTYIEQCKQEADRRELCGKKVMCCRRKVCGTGFENNCVNCEERRDWEKSDKTVETVTGEEKECRELEMEDCLALQDQIMECINAMGNNACDKCFQEIYPGQYYKFVGRSGEDVVILWKLFARSLTEDNTYYFYSKIKVWDDEGNLVYESIVHQKAFVGNFSIFNAAALLKDKIEQGKNYYVKLYYFIPSVPDANLRMAIYGADITAVRVRE